MNTINLSQICHNVPTHQDRESHQTYCKNRFFFGKLHPPIEFVFLHNARNFIVEEIPLYPFSETGEHRILKIRKKDMSTLELLSILADLLHIRQKDIGYAGLKDKHALTYQYISIPNRVFLQYEKALQQHEKFKILQSWLHHNKIRIGHLRGNRFLVRLKKVTPLHFKRLHEEFMIVQKRGFPNFFGYQRFGNFGDNYKQAQYIRKSPTKQNVCERLIVSSLQSYYFNAWLEERIKITSLINSFPIHEAALTLQNTYNLNIDNAVLSILRDSHLPFIPLYGDVCMHYPHGKFFYFGDSINPNDRESQNHTLNKNNSDIPLTQLANDIKRLKDGQISVTGLLSGIGCGIDKSSVQNDRKDCMQGRHKKSRVLLSKNDAAIIENNFCHEILAFGTRRFAWVYPTNVEIEYKEREHVAVLMFELPSGSYATSLLEYLKNDTL